MVGTITRRCALGSAARASSQVTPEAPRLSVSAIMWACPTRTKSAASKKSPTASWCLIAHCRAGPISPASMARSSSPSRIRPPAPSCTVAPRPLLRRRLLEHGGNAGHLAFDQLLQTLGPALGGLGGGAAELDVAPDRDRIVERLVQRGAQLGDDVRGRCLRRHHGIPGAEDEIDARLLAG